MIFEGFWAFLVVSHPFHSSRNTSTSQGQTFEKIGILLRQSVFIPGQLYVAVSRVRSLDGLRFYTYLHLANNERVNKKNIVYTEVLNH
jgi:hypothetical protein